MFYRKQRFSRLAEQEAAIATEFELIEPVAEAMVTSSEPVTDTEKEVALTR